MYDFKNRMKKIESSRFHNQTHHISGEYRPVRPGLRSTPSYNSSQPIGDVRLWGGSKIPQPNGNKPELSA